MTAFAEKTGAPEFDDLIYPVLWRKIIRRHYNGRRTPVLTRAHKKKMKLLRFPILLNKGESHSLLGTCGHGFSCRRTSVC
jgi:hypothetical protein